MNIEKIKNKVIDELNEFYRAFDVPVPHLTTEGLKHAFYSIKEDDLGPSHEHPLIGYDVKFNLKQVVYLITDPDQVPRIVTNLIITTNGVMYTLNSGTTESTHYDFEISSTKNIITSTTS